MPLASARRLELDFMSYEETAHGKDDQLLFSRMLRFATGAAHDETIDPNGQEYVLVKRGCAHTVAVLVQAMAYLSDSFTSRR